MWNISAVGSQTAVAAYVAAYPPDPGDLANFNASKAFILSSLSGYTGMFVQLNASGQHAGGVSSVSITVSPLFMVPEPLRK